MNRRSLVTSVLVAFSVCSFLQAEPVVIDVDLSQPASYMIQISVDQDGEVVARRIPVSLSLRAGGTPLPENPDPQPELGQMGRAIRDRALAVTGDQNRARHALELAALYREVSKRAIAGEYKAPDPKDTPDLLLKIIKNGADLVLDKDMGQWAGVRGQVSNYWNRLAEEGGNVQDFCDLLDEIADGLEAATPAVKGEARRINITKILEILARIERFLEIIKDVTGGAGPPAAATDK